MDNKPGLLLHGKAKLYSDYAPERHKLLLGISPRRFAPEWRLIWKRGRRPCGGSGGRQAPGEKNPQEKGKRYGIDGSRNKSE